MKMGTEAPWHRASYDRFLQERLPALLAERLPLGGYRVEPNGEHSCAVHITLTSAEGEATAIYQLPYPDALGRFAIEERQFVVPPVADRDELECAEIRCVGERLYDELAGRLGQSPPGLVWNEEGLRTWLPLEEWTRAFVRAGQPLDATNWLATRTQVRRLLLPEHSRLFTAGHFGRVCPIETPEGPMVGRVLSIARGAVIRDGRLVIEEASVEAQLGLSASMIPFLEHNDPCRLIMGANMMRQWMTPPDPEPALIQTGNEPDEPAFWCGRNLLTAYVSAGWETFEDSILLSESCAKRLNYPFPIQPGDKMSNRYGNKGIVSRILPDDIMPHLEDGTPVELAFSPMGLYSRMTFGQLREAVLSVAAKREGNPILIPPFHAPDASEVKERLVRAGLPESGMRRLRSGKNGELLDWESTVGWVYWGRLYQLANRKIKATVTRHGAQRQGMPEFAALSHSGAFATIHEHFHVRSADQPDAHILAERLAAAPIERASPPTPMFARLQKRLAAAGIRVALEGEALRFGFAPYPGETLTLAQPFPHPWHTETLLTEMGLLGETPEVIALREANARLSRMIANQVPDSLRSKAAADLETHLRAYFASLLPRDILRFETRVTFGGMAVATPGGELNHDEVGIPEEVAWTLFSPQLTYLLGDAEAVRRRTETASHALDALMARSWVLLHRAPVVAPYGLLAFHPRRAPGQVMRIHPFANELLNADFDGDQLSVFLPITTAGQREAGEKLTIVAHIARDPQIAPLVRPIHDARFGLALLSRTPEGRKEIEALAGVPLPDEGIITPRSLVALQTALLEKVGAAGMLDALDRLTKRGFAESKRSGASLSAFPTLDVEPPAKPQSDDPNAWNAYLEEYIERTQAYWEDPKSNDDPTALTLKCGARGSTRLLLKIVGVQGVVASLNGVPYPIKHGYAEGLTPEEVVINCIGSREGIAQGQNAWFGMQKELVESVDASGRGTLARAMRAKNPGIVFARAAAPAETDPLNKPYLRLFVGLPAV